MLIRVESYSSSGICKAHLSVSLGRLTKPSEKTSLLLKNSFESALRIYLKGIASFHVNLPTGGTDMEANVSREEQNASPS